MRANDYQVENPAQRNDIERRVSANLVVNVYRSRIFILVARDALSWKTGDLGRAPRFLPTRDPH